MYSCASKNHSKVLRHPFNSLEKNSNFQKGDDARFSTKYSSASVNSGGQKGHQHPQYLPNPSHVLLIEPLDLIWRQSISLVSCPTECHIVGERRRRIFFRQDSLALNSHRQGQGLAGQGFKLLTKICARQSTDRSYCLGTMCTSSV